MELGTFREYDNLPPIEGLIRNISIVDRAPNGSFPSEQLDFHNDFYWQLPEVYENWVEFDSLDLYTYIDESGEFIRPSEASQTTSDFAISFVGLNDYRIEPDLMNPGSGGYLAESQSTNIITYSIGDLSTYPLHG